MEPPPLRATEPPRLPPIEPPNPPRGLPTERDGRLTGPEDRLARGTSLRLRVGARAPDDSDREELLERSTLRGSLDRELARGANSPWRPDDLTDRDSDADRDGELEGLTRDSERGENLSAPRDRGCEAPLGVFDLSEDLASDAPERLRETSAPRLGEVRSENRGPSDRVEPSGARPGESERETRGAPEFAEPEEFSKLLQFVELREREAGGLAVRPTRLRGAVEASGAERTASPPVVLLPA